MEGFQVDELRSGLELATDDELRAMTGILFARKFNPLDYVSTPDPIDIQAQSRKAWLDSLEQRFRFLAADGLTVLKGASDRVTYRQVLVQICRHLKINYSQDFSVDELEAEIFLNLLHRAWKQLPPAQQKVLNGQLQHALSESQLAKQIPASVHQDPMSLAFKGGSALAVSSVLRPWLLQQITRQFAIHAATFQVAKQAIVQGGLTAAAQIESQVALQMAYRGMAVNAARYGAVRTVFSFLGPAMWAWFFADLGWRTIATNYGRIIPVVFTLAQIRLTRTGCIEVDVLAANPMLGSA